MTINASDKVKKGFSLTAIAQASGALAAVIGLVAILGWLTGYLRLASFGSPVPMAPSTALLFILYGSAVFLRVHNPLSSTLYRLAMSIGLTGAFAATVLFFLSYLGIHLSVEHLGIPISGTANGVPIGHISPLTAFCFVLAGFSCVATLSSTKDSTGLATAGFWLACLVILISFVLLLAYLFGTPILYGGRFIPPAFSTSLAFIALGIALLVFAGLQTRSNSVRVEAVDKRTLNILLLVFVILAAGIISAGYFYYHSYEKDFRAEVDHQLSAIAKIKVDGLVNWREERLGDGAVFFKNDNFTARVRQYLKTPGDSEARTKLRTWISQFQAANEYDRIFLLDTEGVERMSVPDSTEPVDPHLLQHASETMRSGQVVFLDFYRKAPDQSIRIAILVPILDRASRSRSIGLLVLSIDPQKYLYPFISSWPTPSRTAEALIVRKDGNEALFLNELRFQKNTALNLRIPLENMQMPALKAVLGQVGIFEGIDYRKAPVIAYAQSVPKSPWFLVAKIDTSEVYTPLREQLWGIVILIGALLICAGAGTGFVWRRQRMRYYREMCESAESLRESEGRFRLLVEGVKDYAIFMLDREGKVVSWNEGAERIKDYKSEEIIGKNFSCFYPAEDIEKQKPEGQLKVAAEEGRFEEEGWRLRKNGSLLWANSIITALRDGQGQVVGFSLITRDLTERKRAEEHIRKLNRTLAMLSDINEAIVRIRKLQELFEKACSIAVEKGNFSLAWIGLLDDSTEVIQPVASAGKSGGYLEKINLSLTDEARGYGPIYNALRKGEHVICNVIRQDEDMDPCQKIALDLGFRSCASLPLKVSGSVRGTVNFYTDEPHFFDDEELKLLDELAMDISFAMEFAEKEAERERAEDEKEKLYTQLLQAQKMEAVGQLAGGIAHDFNNILTAIIGYGHILKMKLKEDDPLRTYAGHILSLSDKAANLTQSLLAFSRKQIMNPRPVNLNEVIKTVERLLSRIIGEDIKLQTHLSEKDLIVMADHVQIEQVLMNLATNARDAMSEGGVLSIDTQTIDIDHEFIREHGFGAVGTYALMLITDTGVGMDKETREKIFEPFFTTKAVGKGTGLGLSMVYGIIKQHEGYINVYSEHGKGTTFRIYLPLIQAKAEEIKPEVIKPIETGTETILLAEDETEVREFTKKLLSEYGYKVIDAVNGRDAIEKFNLYEDKIQLLLLDVIMPERNGREVYEKIKETRTDVKVLFMSGYPGDHIDGLIEKGSEFISKPVSPTKLLQKIREVLEK